MRICNNIDQDSGRCLTQKMKPSSSNEELFMVKPAISCVYSENGSQQICNPWSGGIARE